MIYTTPQPVKMTKARFIGLMSKYGFKTRKDVCGIAAKKGNIFITADTSRFNEKKVTNFEVLEEGKELRKMTYVWELKLYLKQLD